MAIMKTVTAAQKLIRETLSRRDKQAESALNLITQAEENINSIDQRMEEAAKEGNPIEYKKAKQEKEDAQDVKEMYERRYNAFIRQPQISEADYERITAEIIAEYGAMQLKARGELARLAEEMNSISDHLNAAFIEANKALKSLQHDLFMDCDRMKHPKTGACINPSDELNISDFSVIRWGRVGVEHIAYSDYIRDRESNEQ